MAQTVDNSLEGRMLELEAQVRALRTANPFGMVAAEADLTGVPGGQLSVTKAADDNGTGLSTGFRAKTEGPRVDVYVAGGRLRVDMSASVNPLLAGTIGAFGHLLLGPAADQASLGAAPTARTANTGASVRVLVPSGTGSALVTASNYDIHTGLEPGWYRAEGRYLATYDAGVNGSAYFWGTRLAATPY
jgi:hypothetical protein